jgi:hypothetical protein
MTPEELFNIPSLVDGSDEVEDVHALQSLLQSIRMLAEKGLGRSHDAPKFHVRAVFDRSGMSLRFNGFRG